MPTIVTLPGDGIGPEVLAAALEVLNEVAPDLDVRGAPHRRRGDRRATAPRSPTRRSTRPRSDAVLLAAVGGPKWDTTDPDKPRPEQGLLGLRQGLGLFANLRPVRPLPALYDASPLKREIIERTDLLVVRELTGGIYFGEKDAHRRPRATTSARTHGRDRADRAHRVRGGALAGHQRRQGQRARDRRLWRETVKRVHSQEFPNIELQHVLVDNAAMQLDRQPRATST